MQVKVKFHCRDIAGNLRNGDFDIPEGSTVKQFMDIIQAEAGETISEQNLDSIVYMVDGKAADENTVMKDGSFLRVLYKILGG